MATSTKNWNFIFINTSVWWATKVSYELFSLGGFDLDKVWKWHYNIQNIFQTSTAWQQHVHPQPSVPGKTPMENHKKCSTEYVDLFELGNRWIASTWPLKLLPNSSHWLSCQAERLCTSYLIHTTQHQWFGEILSQYREILNFYKLFNWCLVCPWKAWSLISGVTHHLLQETHARYYMYLAVWKTSRSGNVSGL